MLGIDEAVEWLRAGAELLSCPSCPTAVATRDMFFADEVGTRLMGMLAPFVVTIGLVVLVVGKLGKRSKEAHRDSW